MKQQRIPIVLVAVFAVLFFVAYTIQAAEQGAQPSAQTQQNTNFTNLVASGDVTAGDDLAVGDDAAITGVLSVGEFAGISAQTAISVTNSSVITATGSYQPLTSAGTVTATVAAGAAGRVLVLTNTAATTINIQDTGIQKLSAAAALGQYDALILWSDGTNWIEISRSDN